MKPVYAKHEPYWDTGHLAEIIEEMKTRGQPTIRVIESGGKFFALEGSHRLAAAHYLGVEPKLVVEIPEMGEDCNTFWDRISFDLPLYEFDKVQVLYLENFK